MQVLVAEHKSALTSSCHGTSYSFSNYAQFQPTCGLNYDSPIYSQGFGKAGDATYVSPAWTGVSGAIAPAFGHAEIRYDDALTPGHNCGSASCGTLFSDATIQLKPGTAFMANSKSSGQIRFNSGDGRRAGGRLYHDTIAAHCGGHGGANGSTEIARGGIGTLRKCDNSNHGGSPQLFYGWYTEYGHNRDSATVALWVR
jgi:hypothetical protein